MVQLQKKWRGAGKVMRGYVPRLITLSLPPLMHFKWIQSWFTLALQVLCRKSYNFFPLPPRTTFTARVMRHQNEWWKFTLTLQGARNENCSVFSVFCRFLLTGKLLVCPNSRWISIHSLFSLGWLFTNISVAASELMGKPCRRWYSCRRIYILFEKSCHE